MSLELALERNTAALTALLAKLNIFAAPTLQFPNTDPVSAAAAEDFAPGPVIRILPPSDPIVAAAVEEAQVASFTLSVTPVEPTRYFHANGQYFTVHAGESIPSVEGLTEITEAEFSAPRVPPADATKPLTYDGDVKPALKALSEKPNGRALLAGLLKTLGVDLVRNIPEAKFAKALALAAAA